MNDAIIFIVGPTAVGITGVAINLARRINAEIISCDSMQIYKSMDIITAKPSLVLTKKIPYYLIDVISPNKEYNVSRYCQEAKKKIKAIFKKGKIPLVVGGTGLYMSSLVYGIFKAKSENKNIRRRLYQEAKKRGSEYLHNRLKIVDVQAAEKIHPHDTKRIIRALEVFESTGKPISYLQKQRKGLKDEYAVKIFCLNLARQALHQKIEERIDKMFASGLVNEVKKLVKLKLSRTASCAIGVKELKGYFAGNYDLKEAKRLIKRNSRLYAKRQLTWFRKDKGITWINLRRKDTPKKIVTKIWKKLY
jgi:tRNA dimethylallyltransferase